MNALRELERRLCERDEELRRREETITFLERQLDERDATVRHLRNEIDKFRQVVRPITQQLVLGLHNGEDEDWDPAKRLRTKRQAISAEPILGDLAIAKVPKSAK